MRFFPAALFGWVKILGGSIKAASITGTGLTANLPLWTDANKTLVTKSVADTLTALGIVDPLLYKGVLDCSASPNYPAADAGHCYIISVAGKIGGASGLTVAVGDMAICKTDSSASGDQAAVGANWNVVEKNIDLTNLVVTALTASTLKVTTGAVNGYILQSDASGNLSYADPAAAANAGLYAITNPKAMSQGVYMTYAASGSTGIRVADNANINFGTGNFALVWRGGLPDWSVNSTLFQKLTAGLVGIRVTANATGRNVSVRINSNTYESTSVQNFVDGTVHELVFSVVRETATANGSVSYYWDGVLSGVTVIPAAAPASVDNTESLYVCGSGTSRIGSTLRSFGVFNRALTAAEVLGLYRNGIAYADKWGTTTPLFSDDCADDSIADWTKSGVTLAFDTDHYTITSSTAGAIVYRENLSLVAGKKYRATAVMKDGTSSGAAFTLRLYDGAAMDSVGYTTAASDTTYSWTFTPATTTATGLIGIRLTNSLAGGNIQLSEFLIERVGATLALEPEGIQPAPGQWLDSSSNKLHAMQPASGSSLIRPEREFEVRWTNTWAGTHEAQYIGGVNQAVLPANCYIESIIGTVSGATVEDIIIGDGSDTDRWVEATTGLSTGTYSFTLANRISDGTNYKLVVDPDANFTGSIAFTVRGYILD